MTGGWSMLYTLRYTGNLHTKLAPLTRTQTSHHYNSGLRWPLMMTLPRQRFKKAKTNTLRKRLKTVDAFTGPLLSRLRNLENTRQPQTDTNRTGTKTLSICLCQEHLRNLEGLSPNTATRCISNQTTPSEENWFLQRNAGTVTGETRQLPQHSRTSSSSQDSAVQQHF